MGWLAQVKAKYTVCASTLTLWHGGNLEIEKDAIMHKGGRWEHGPGLYLTTHYDTARKYAKGARKLYRVVIRRGTNLSDARIPVARAVDFVGTYVIGTKRKDVVSRIEKHAKASDIDADTFLNILINEDAVKSTYTDKLREFLVQNGIDYSIVDNAFGWHERMLVLFNMKNIVSKTRVLPKDKIETFDLPKEFTK